MQPQYGHDRNDQIYNCEACRVNRKPIDNSENTSVVDLNNLSDLMHYSKKPNRFQDVHHITTLDVKHDAEPRFQSDYRYHYQPTFKQHTYMNGPYSP